MQNSEMDFIICENIKGNKRLNVSFADRLEIIYAKDFDWAQTD